MDIIISEIFKALGYLFISIIVFCIYEIARKNASNGRHTDVLWKGFLICLGISLFAGFTLGNPSCIDNEYDVRGYSCQEYADNSFEPTNKERASQLAYYMTLLYLPVLIGALQERKNSNLCD
jgi:hypothetical protein